MNIFSLISALVALGVAIPMSSALALSVDEIIEAAKSGNGTYVESHSSVSTGGQTAKSGESITTGDARATTHTEIRTDNDGGEVNVRVETSENGATETKEYTAPLPKGESAQVRIEAHANSGDGTSEAVVTVDDVIVPEEAPQRPSSSQSERSSLSLLFSERIPSFVRKIVELFAWW